MHQRRSLGRWLLLAVGALGLGLMASPAAWWSRTIRPARPHDDAIWLKRTWLHESVPDAEIESLVAQMRAHRITTIYPFVGPMKPGGSFGWRDGESLREYDPEVARSFFSRLRAAEGASVPLVVLPWTGGVLGRDVLLSDPLWRADLVAQAKALVDLGADGLQVNVEPMPEESAGYLDLLRELKAALGPKKLVSVAAYPPRTPLHPYADVHWSLDFLRSVCAAADDVSVMEYDTALTKPEEYSALVSTWTVELSAALDPLTGPEPRPTCHWRVGVPTYEDDKPWHRPDAETLAAALDGVSRAASEYEAGFVGLAVYASWTTDEAEWAVLDGG